MKCAICGIRKPRRFCPGVQGNICTICCGTERENSVNCPLTCEFLLEAHRHEKHESVDPKTIPNGEVRISEQFLEENQALLAFVGSTLVEAAVEQNATDLDIREALKALTQTYKTLESGLIYEYRPDNMFAAAIAERVQGRLRDLREKEAQARGVSTIRDTAIFGVLVFFERLEHMENNGRPKSKSFLDFLARFALAPVPGGGIEESSAIVQPDEGRIIL